MQTDLVEGPDDVPVGDGVTDPGARHSVGLREGAHADQPGVLHIDGEYGVRRHEIEVGLVENEEAIRRHAVQEVRDGVAAVVRTRRVVRIG